MALMALCHWLISQNLKRPLQHQLCRHRCELAKGPKDPKALYVEDRSNADAPIVHAGCKPCIGHALPRSGTWFWMIFIAWANLSCLSRVPAVLLMKA